MRPGLRKTWSHFIRQRGAAVTEMVVVLPALLLVGLGAIQWALIYEAKSTLNHAAIMAARAGAVDHASPTSMKVALARGLVPLYSPDKGATLLDTGAYARAALDVFGPFTRVRIINPTQEAFEDFGTDETGEGELEIPNLRLHLKDTAPGSASGVNVQDANLLKVEILHGHKLKVPFVGPLLAQASLLTTSDPQRVAMLADNRIPMLTTATVRMQSAARQSNLVKSVEQVDRDLLAALESGEGGDAGDGDGNTGGGDGDTGGGSGGGPGEEEPPEEFECETTTPEEDNQGAQDEDRGFWGNLWDGIKDGLTQGYEFVKGFWQGIKNQLGDLLDLVLHPIETAKGLIELGKAFFNDFEGTIKMIGEALGQDFSTLVHCGAFDRGRIIGEYANPVFMLKLATRLAKFGSLAKAVQNTLRIQKRLGCASFGAGTEVWTSDGLADIETLQQGQLVMARSDATYVDQPQQITDLLGRTAPNYHVLITEFEQIEVTEEHPLWVQGKGWTAVKEIERGDSIASINGDVLVVHNVRKREPLTVHNFSVANTPNYFVGASGLWSHNASKTCGLVGDTVGTSGKLRTRLARVQGNKRDPNIGKKGFQAHHLIPSSLVKEFRELFDRLEDIGFDINNANNGWMLPDKKTKEAAQKILDDPNASAAAKADAQAIVDLPTHQGPHPAEYMDRVREMLNDIDGDLADLDDADLLDRIYQVQDQIRKELADGSISPVSRPGSG